MIKKGPIRLFLIFSVVIALSFFIAPSPSTTEAQSCNISAYNVKPRVTITSDGLVEVSTTTVAEEESCGDEGCDRQSFPAKDIRFHRSNTLGFRPTGGEQILKSSGSTGVGFDFSLGTGNYYYQLEVTNGANTTVSNTSHAPTADRGRDCRNETDSSITLTRVQQVSSTANSITFDLFYNAYPAPFSICGCSQSGCSQNNNLEPDYLEMTHPNGGKSYIPWIPGIHIKCNQTVRQCGGTYCTNSEFKSTYTIGLPPNISGQFSVKGSEKPTFKDSGSGVCGGFPTTLNFTGGTTAGTSIKPSSATLTTRAGYDAGDDQAVRAEWTGQLGQEVKLYRTTGERWEGSNLGRPTVTKQGNNWVYTITDDLSLQPAGTYYYGIDMYDPGLCYGGHVKSDQTTVVWNKQVASTCEGKANKHPTLTGNKTQADIPLDQCGEHLYHITGNLNITGNLSGAQTGLIFVDGNLSIGPNLPGNRLAFGVNTSGLVFIVKGDVFIDPSVIQVNAVIISSGTIYTAASTGSTCSRSSPVSTNQLIINGSLISINPDKPIQFCRTLPSGQNNTTAAERINAQPKYLVVLRNLLSETYEKWAEIDVSISSPGTLITDPSAPPPPPPVAAPVTKKVFITRDTYSGLSSGQRRIGGLAGADTICQQEAAAASLGGTWKAWLSDNTANAADRLTRSSAGYMLVNERRIADSWEDLISVSESNPLENPINLDASGNPVGNPGTVWTATAPNGTLIPTSGGDRTCRNWATTNPQETGLVGDVGYVNSRWTQSIALGQTCNNFYRLYCFEQ